MKNEEFKNGSIVSVEFKPKMGKSNLTLRQLVDKYMYKSKKNKTNGNTRRDTKA